jgi:Flp pilus assembly protein TadG
MLKYLLKRLKKDEGGAAAIEFSIVALPFFAIMFATFEIAMLYWAQGVLIESVEPQARKGMTGQIQKSGGFTPQTFRNEICANVGGMFDCEKFVIDARPLANFTQFESRSLLVSSANQFDLGQRGDIVMVRVGYPWQTIFPFTAGITFDLSNMDGGRRMMQVTSIIRNEKF